MERNLDSVEASVVHIVNFLLEQFDKGLSYRSINCYRSAISAGHSLINGKTLGKNVIVCRVMKCIRWKRPPKPKYQSVGC